MARYPNDDARRNPYGPTDDLGVSPMPSPPPQLSPEDAASLRVKAGMAPSRSSAPISLEDMQNLIKASRLSPAEIQGMLPEPKLPQAPNFDVLRSALDNATRAGLVHNIANQYIPGTYGVMKGMGPQQLNAGNGQLLQRQAMQPAQEELQRTQVGNEQAVVQNQFGLERGKLGAQVGMHNAQSMSGLLGRYLGIKEAQDRQQRQFEHADASQQRAFGQAEKMFGEHTVAKQNDAPAAHEVGAARLASNAMMASQQMRDLIDQDRSAWDKGLVSHVPFTKYTIGTDTAKKFAALQGAMISQLTQSDEVRRTTGNINDALGQTVVNPGDNYETAKWKMDMFDKMMSGIHKTVAINHPLWAVSPGHPEFSKYVTPDMIQTQQKTPQQRAGEYLSTVKALTPAESSDSFDPDEFLK